MKEKGIKIDTAYAPQICNYPPPMRPVVGPWESRQASSAQFWENISFRHAVFTSPPRDRRPLGVSCLSILKLKHARTTPAPCEGCWSIFINHRVRVRAKLGSSEMIVQPFLHYGQKKKLHLATGMQLKVHHSASFSLKKRYRKLITSIQGILASRLKIGGAGRALPCAKSRHDEASFPSAALS